MKPTRQMSLQLNPLICRAHGLCAQELPEAIRLDEWGYPILDGAPVARHLIGRARAAANACPVLALRLTTSRTP